MKFKKYIGIDYSGAKTPISRLQGLRIFKARGTGKPEEIQTSTGNGTSATHMRWNWTRKEIAKWLVEELSCGDHIVVGIDHAFSFPNSYFECYNIKNWDNFLDDFCYHWPTDNDNNYVDSIRHEHPCRTGEPNEYRLTEKRTSSAKSVFKFDGQGAVGKASHAGIPWLKFIRRDEKLKNKLHFWPFDGLDIPSDKSVLLEVWPSIFSKRYSKNKTFSSDQHDAYCVAKWLQESDANGFLKKYFTPPLTTKELSVVSREGWILGIF